MTETMEAKPETQICDLCGGATLPLDEGDVNNPCACAERFGHILLRAHREYQEVEQTLRAGRENKTELMPIILYTRSGQRLEVLGGVELCSASIGKMAFLREVSIGDSDVIDFDQVEVRLDEIAWVGFNIP